MPGTLVCCKVMKCIADLRLVIKLMECVISATKTKTRVATTTPSLVYLPKRVRHLVEIDI